MNRLGDRMMTMRFKFVRLKFASVLCAVVAGTAMIAAAPAPVLAQDEGGQSNRRVSQTLDPRVAQALQAVFGVSWSGAAGDIQTVLADVMRLAELNQSITRVVAEERQNCGLSPQREKNELQN